MSGLRAALSFLTPLGRPAPPSPRALVWFPVVGAGLGALLGVIWWAAARAWEPLAAAALVVVADLALTGLLHLDGLVDAADGLLPQMDRVRRLEVMGDPRAGAFGIAAAAAALLVKFAALATTRQSVLLLAGLWCASRTVMAGATLVAPYARNSGLATAFLGGGWPVRAATLSGLAAGLALLAAWSVGPGIAVFATAIVSAGCVLALACRRIGGFTGDVLGAAGVVAESLGLLVAAARW